MGYPSGRLCIPKQARCYVNCQEGQSSGHYVHKRYSYSTLVPDSDRAGTSMVEKCLKADFSGRLLAKNGSCSVSNRHFGTRLPGLSARKIIQNLLNGTKPATLRLMTAYVAPSLRCDQSAACGPVFSLLENMIDNMTGSWHIFSRIVVADCWIVN